MNTFGESKTIEEIMVQRDTSEKKKEVFSCAVCKTKLTEEEIIWTMLNRDFVSFCRSCMKEYDRKENEEMKKIA